MFAPETIRQDFPLFDHLIYLDSAATSLSPRQVVEAQTTAEYTYRANVGRGVHRLGRMATHKFEEARRTLQHFLGGENGTLAFTRNTTEGINIVARGLNWNPADRVIVALQEHHSNLLPWLSLEKAGIIAGVDIVGGTGGTIRPADIEAAITPATRMIAAAHASNVFGTIAPVAAIARICRKNDLLFLLDGAQTAPHLPISLAETGCDYFAFSGHKMLGPMGTGGLWMRNGAPAPAPAYTGGGMVKTVSGHSFLPVDGPARFEAGTPNVIGAIGLAEAARYLSALGMNAVAAHSSALAHRMITGLSAIDGVRVFTPDTAAPLVGAVSFAVTGVHPHDVAYLLDEAAGIMVRSGEHCCQPLMQQIAPAGGGTVRASAYCYNTEDDIDLLIAAVEEISRMVQ